MDTAPTEKLIQRSLANLSQKDPAVLQKELDSVEKYLKNEVYFLAAINSAELLDLVISIFVTSITTMATISNILSSSTNPLRKNCHFKNKAHVIVM